MRNQKDNKKSKSRQLAVGASAGILGGLGIGGVLIAVGLFSPPSGSLETRVGAGPALVELFTSQGCYNCPDAEKMLGELIETGSDVVALEFHVDYWDDLEYGDHGSHKDPFSDKMNTLRQEAYNKIKLEGQRGIFTPQIVINGRYTTVGTREKEVRKGIEVVDRPGKLSVSHNPELDSINGKTGLRIELDSSTKSISDSAKFWVAVFDVEKTTQVMTGENHSKSLKSHHIVRHFSQVPMVTGVGGSESRVGSDYQVVLGKGQGCAVILQDEALGAVYAAAYCPFATYGDS